MRVLSRYKIDPKSESPHSDWIDDIIRKMKRLRRWIFNGLAAMSLLVCIASATLWIRTIWAQDFRKFVLSSGSIGDMGVPNVHDFTPPRQNSIEDFSISSSFGKLYLDIEYLRPILVLSLDEFDVETRQASIVPYISRPSLSRGFGFPGFRWNDQLAPLDYFHKPNIYDFTSQRQIIISDWFLILLTSILPIIWLRQYRRRQRFGPGQCSVCGYDLRATPNKCPECGMIPPAHAKPK